MGEVATCICSFLKGRWFSVFQLYIFCCVALAALKLCRSMIFGAKWFTISATSTPSEKSRVKLRFGRESGISSTHV